MAPKARLIVYSVIPTNQEILVDATDFKVEWFSAENLWFFVFSGGRHFPQQRLAFCWQGQRSARWKCYIHCEFFLLILEYVSKRSSHCYYNFSQYQCIKSNFLQNYESGDSIMELRWKPTPNPSCLCWLSINPCSFSSLAMTSLLIWYEFDIFHSSSRASKLNSIWWILWFVETYQLNLFQVQKDIEEYDTTGRSRPWESYGFVERRKRFAWYPYAGVSGNDAATIFEVISCNF